MIINNRRTCPGHIQKPLFFMIPLENWILDELHILLRVTDRLWSLVLAEFDINNNKVRNIVCNKKLKILCEFDLAKLFNQPRAILTRQLWDKFYQLYGLLHNIETTKDIFENKAKKWVELFLTPTLGTPNTSEFIKRLYKPSEITPYIHLLYNHIPDKIQNHNKSGIRAFSCAPVEKKNHQQT
ncbi:18669_t:CDS:2, partial [Gigaspora rosea]